MTSNGLAILKLHTSSLNHNQNLKRTGSKMTVSKLLPQILLLLNSFLWYGRKKTIPVLSFPWCVWGDCWSAWVISMQWVRSNHDNFLVWEAAFCCDGDRAPCHQMLGLNFFLSFRVKYYNLNLSQYFSLVKILKICLAEKKIPRQLTNVL